MVHTDTCFLYHGVTTSLPDMANQRSGNHIKITLHATFLCSATDNLVYLVNC